MKRFFKESLSPTMAVAILALVVATGGTGYAAARFGNDSAASKQGIASAQLAGAAAQPVLRSGKTMVGYYAAGGSDGTTGYIGEGITFPAKLPAGFNNNHVQYLAQGDPFTTRCPGPGSAKRGWMCFYEGQSSGVDLCCIYDQSYNSPAVANYGVRIYWSVNGSSSYADGQWVVRAP
ncbi:hypothetical protein [Nocardioides pelophilus]|uniref:hypothetical protein n=1 Tax=Nocardioides pelophilus TaxID=2172019 RepID=UPI001603F721|nr:hypothetical protein [Nocardioides pelophilus]